MANINAPQIEYFESFANEITSKFRRLQSIVGHPTASGDYHEEILRTVLRNFLSKRFSVKRGFIYAGPNQLSRQMDIMIVDENSPAAYIFQEGDFAVVIPEAVVAVMEVKTAFNASEFDQSLENIASAKRLMGFPANLTGIVFGFDGTEPTNDILDGWFKREVPTGLRGQEVMMPDAILFFKENTLLVRCNEQARIGPDGNYYHKMMGTDDQQAELQGFAFQVSVTLALIINACERKQFTITHHLPEGQGMHLFQAERGGLSLERFSLGDGMSKISLPAE